MTTTLKSPSNAIEGLMSTGHFDSDSFYLLAAGITSKDDLANVSFFTDTYRHKPAYCAPKLDDDQAIPYKKPAKFYDKNGQILFADAVGLQNFIKPNHYTEAVPVAVAIGLADSFLAGLIAKLYSAELFEVVVPSSIQTIEPFPLLTVPEANQLSSAAFKVDVPDATAALRALSQVETYYSGANLNDPKINPTKPLISRQIWLPRFVRAQRRLNFKVAEMLSGWRYGCEVLSDSAKKDEVVHDLKSLIAPRFKPRACWKITAYVLTYLEGWSKGVERVKKRGERNLAAFNDPPETVLESLSAASQPALAVDLYRRLVVIATGLTLDAAGASAKNKESAGQAATQFQECVAAYNEGISSALPELFTDAYELGFERGYQSGFMDGHATAAASGVEYAQKNDLVAENIRNVFKGATPTLEGAISLAKDVAKVWAGDFSPIKKQVDKAKSWVKKTFGIGW
jgi:hypothetical protein